MKNENISQRFKIITTSLLNTQVCVDGSVTRSTGQVFVLSVRDMEMGLWISEFLCETKVDDVDLVSALANAHQEVVRFDITMNEVAGVDVFDTRDL